MTWLLAAGAIAIAVLFSGFFSGAETGIYCLSRLRLHLAARKRDRRAIRLGAILEDEQGLVSATLIGTNLMNYVATATCAYLFAELVGLSEVDTELYTVLCLTPIVFVFGEVVPKSLFQLHANQLMLRASLPLALANRAFRMTGAVWLLTRLGRAVASLAGGENSRTQASPAPRRRVAVLLQDALAGNPLGRDQSDVIEQVCRLSETPVHTVMVPRDRVVSISRDTDLRGLDRVARSTPHARLPVYGTHPRYIVGTVCVDDLLRAKYWTTVGTRLEPAMAVSPQETMANAISHLQSAGQEMAIVTDRGGQMLGIVTLVDLLNDVVHELASTD